MTRPAPDQSSPPRRHAEWPRDVRSAHHRAWYVLSHLAWTEVHLAAIGHPAEALAVSNAACLVESLLSEIGAFDHPWPPR